MPHPILNIWMEFVELEKRMEYIRLVLFSDFSGFVDEDNEQTIIEFDNVHEAVAKIRNYRIGLVEIQS